MTETSTKRIGIYPGTFDPITKGHLDVIGRATKLVDHLIIAVAENIGKDPLFTTAERVAMVKEDLGNLKNEPRASIEVVSFGNLLMNFAMQKGASIIIRGLRAVSDFEYEFQMTGMNARLNSEIETVFLMSMDKYQFISSRFVKEIGRLGGEIAPFVSPHVEARLKAKFRKTA